MKSTESKLVRDGIVLTGNQITDYHKRHMTASYHCTECGYEMLFDGDKFKCTGCGFELRPMR